METNKIYQGNSLDVLKTFPDKSVNCCITSPPYWGLRDYGVDGQLGLESTPEEYVANMVDVFTEVKRILKDDGTLWLNLGDSYWGSGNASGHTEETKNLCANTSKYGATKGHSQKKSNIYKPKDLVGVPWMTAFALRAIGYYLRQDIIWHKPNPMPESVTDRCTKSHEYIFLMAKSQKYYYDADAIKEDAKTDPHSSGWATSMSDRNDRQVDNESNGREWAGDGKANKRDVWTVNTKPYSEAHFATFPEKLIVDMVKAGCPEGGVILDPFFGAGTTGLVARKLNRNYVGIELNPKYIQIADKRIRDEIGLFH